MIYIAETDARPLYEQVYAAVKKEIRRGALAQGTALPPIRKLADELRVSRNTVSHAYQQLVSEGYVRAARGSGYFVDCVPEPNREDRLAAVPHPAPPHRLECDFRYESSSAPDFPWSKWRRYVQEALLQEECRDAAARGDSKGSLALRESLCCYLLACRGVRCTPEQIIICAGVQQGLQTILGLLTARVDRVAFEEPGCSAMRQMFERAGMQVQPVDVQADGIDLDGLQQSDCQLVYVTPSHQFPTGVVTSLEKRRALVHWAAQSCALVIENDYDGEFLYGARPLPAMQAMDTEGRVIYLGTLTKVLGRAMQCAYIVLPAPLLAQYEAQYRAQDSALPHYHQAALAAFIRDGMLERHIRTVSARSREKYAILCDCLQQEGQGIAVLWGSPAGTHTMLRIPQCTDQAALLTWLRSHGVGLYGTKAYWADAAQAREDVFLLGFHAIPVRELRQKVQRLLCLLRTYFGV